MSIDQMRVAITKAYPSDKWAEKVKKMKDGQVRIIYTRLLNQKKL